MINLIGLLAKWLRARPSPTRTQVGDISRTELSLDSKSNYATPRIAWRAGSFPMRVVGESNYQSAFLAICGKHTRDGYHYLCDARIVREPLNPYDPNAVAVMVDGKKVGYLSRDAAQGVAEQMDQEGLASALCGAKIEGGWRTNQHDEGDFGITLAMPNWGWIDFGTGSVRPDNYESSRSWPKKEKRAIPALVDGPLSGLKVAFLGAATDSELAREFAAAGAKVMASVGKSTNLLVVVEERPFSIGISRSAMFMKAQALGEAGQSIDVVSLPEAQALLPQEEVRD